MPVMSIPSSMNSSSLVPLSALPPGFKIVDLSGPEILAHLFHWGLFGTLSTQIYLYYEAFPNDRALLKCLVYSIYILELVQTIIVTHDAFATFGTGFGDISAILSLHFGWLSIPIMSAVVALIGQSFYAYRLYMFSRSRLIPLLILIISLPASVGGFLNGKYAFDDRSNLALLNNRKTSIAAGVWLGGSALSDMIIACSMAYYLSKSQAQFLRSRVLVSRLVRLTIETGALTALATLTLFYAFPTHTYYLTPGLLVPKLYANAILAVLNARIQILGGRGSVFPGSESMLPGAMPSTGGGQRWVFLNPPAGMAREEADGSTSHAATDPASELEVVQMKDLSSSDLSQAV